jgi:hypothetical protein
MKRIEKDKKELVKRVLVLEDDKRTTNKNIEKHQVESDDLVSRIETLGEMVDALFTGFRQLKKTDAIHCK